MPDRLTFTDKLPVEWLPTKMYKKAAMQLLKHTSNKRTPQYHMRSKTEYLVLTVDGVENYKKVDAALVARYVKA
tara:strand:+ start:189 stop:410 length:222 start_codon:yes stop_codon:yes gene_type:complete